MGRCRRKRFDEVKICSHDLDKFIRIEARTLAPVKVGQTNPGVTFTLVKEVWSACTTLRGTRRYQGTNIREEATHLWHVRYDPDLLALEHGDNFVRFESRQFKVLEVTQNDEDRYFLIIQATERGFEDRDAADA
jgi:head-tail adaptor